MQKDSVSIVVILGTGGTMAGSAVDAGDNVGYRAAQIGVAELVAGIPALAGLAMQSEQVAQVDSKDMSFAIWRTLAERVAHHVAREEVAGVVVTHGTDTLEETAYFLQRVLAPAKPVVLTAAMRPASALLRDGPQNLLDAVNVARSPDGRGVVAVLAGRMYSGLEVRKRHPYRLDAFDSGDAGALAEVEEGMLRMHRPWPFSASVGVERLPADHAAWPRVEVVWSHAGANGDLVRALCAAGVRGIVAAGTGNGTLHHELHSALLEAQAQGIRVLRSSRCANGAVLASASDVLPCAGALTPVQARIELMLQLIHDA
jgi:L-asparaginase